MSRVLWFKIICRLVLNNIVFQKYVKSIVYQNMSQEEVVILKFRHKFCFFCINEPCCWFDYGNTKPSNIFCPENVVCFLHLVHITKCFETNNI